MVYIQKKTGGLHSVGHREIGVGYTLLTKRMVFLVLLRIIILKC